MARDSFKPDAINLATGEVCGDRINAEGEKRHGHLGPVTEGEPMEPGTELVRVHQSTEGGIELETLYRHDSTEHKGPAKVSTNAYRQGYDAIFGKKNDVWN